MQLPTGNYRSFCLMVPRLPRFECLVSNVCLACLSRTAWQPSAYEP